jgi:hypothetical protein
MMRDWFRPNIEWDWQVVQRYACTAAGYGLLAGTFGFRVAAAFALIAWGARK